MSHKTIEIISIDDSDLNTRLDTLLNKKLECLPSRAFSRKLIQKGYVSLRGKTVTKPATLISSISDIRVDISCLLEKSESPKGEEIPLSILFEDTDILVVNKDPHMVVHPGAGHVKHTLVNAILSHCKNPLPSLDDTSRAGIVHRLDKETSGAIVIAKSLHALTKLSKQFSEHSQKRVYQALVYGILKDDSGVIETKLTRDKKNRLRFQANNDIGKNAISEYVVKKRFYKSRLTFVECRLRTGRTHQIRVHMQHINHAIVGDKLYKTPNQEQLIPKVVQAYFKKNITHQLLHAQVLGIHHPKDGSYHEFKADKPEDYTNTLNFLDDFEKKL